MIGYGVLVYVSSFFVTLFCTRSGVHSLIIKCQSAADCTSTQICHPFFKICLTKKRSQVPFGKASDQSSCKLKCLVNEYCHPMVQRCLPYLTLPSTRNHMKPTSPNCKNDSNCASNKYCHKRFKKCLDILAIPTLSSTKSTAVACKNDSYCTNQQYCHDFFKICLVKPTMVFNTTTSQTQFACSTNADCQAGHYCHNMTQICLQMRNVTQSTSAASRTKQHFCRTDSDCRITEFCYRIFGTFTNSKPVGARHRRKCSGGSRCSTKRIHHTNTGACIPKMVEFHPSSFDCTRDEDCSVGMCCLKKLGICRHIVRKGEPCVTKNADFICPCSAKLSCKPNPRGKKLKGRRLERKLKIPKRIRQALKIKGLLYHKKYLYGRCQHVST